MNLIRHLLITTLCILTSAAIARAQGSAGRAPLGDDVATLAARYANASSDEERDLIRNRLRRLFRTSKSDVEKQQIRGFFIRYTDPPLNEAAAMTSKARTAGALHE